MPKTKSIKSWHNAILLLILSCEFKVFQTPSPQPPLTNWLDSKTINWIKCYKFCKFQVKNQQAPDSVVNFKATEPKEKKNEVYNI